MVRQPAVAGSFYPGSGEALKQTMESLFSSISNDTFNVVGSVSPHAGYIYSGATAVKAISALGPALTYVVIGPSHHGRGAELAVSAEDWRTPMGEMKCDLEFVKKLPAPVTVDEASHHTEHSIEVQLPFIQYIYPSADLVCICMGDQSQGAATAVAKSVLSAQKTTGREIRVIASSDFSHYVPAETAKKNDGAVLSAITEMDVNSMYDRLAETGASVCGYGPIAATIEISRGLGAKKGELLEYTNSGEVSGDFKQVVGYAAVAFYT